MRSKREGGGRVSLVEIVVADVLIVGDVPAAALGRTRVLEEVHHLRHATLVKLRTLHAVRVSAREETNRTDSRMVSAADFRLPLSCPDFSFVLTSLAADPSRRSCVACTGVRRRV